MDSMEILDLFGYKTIEELNDSLQEYEQTAKQSTDALRKFSTIRYNEQDYDRQTVTEKNIIELDY